jgi:hypothetical protein
MHYSRARAEFTPTSLEACRRNNKLQRQQSLEKASDETLEILIEDLCRERHSVLVRKEQLDCAIAEARDHLARRREQRS